MQQYPETAGTQETNSSARVGGLSSRAMLTSLEVGTIPEAMLSGRNNQKNRELLTSKSQNRIGRNNFAVDHSSTIQTSTNENNFNKNRQKSVTVAQTPKARSFYDGTSSIMKSQNNEERDTYQAPINWEAGLRSKPRANMGSAMSQERSR